MGTEQYMPGSSTGKDLSYIFLMDSFHFKHIFSPDSVQGTFLATRDEC